MGCIIRAPVARINVISSSKGTSRKGFFRTHYFSDPWPLPFSITTLDEGKVGGMAFPMSAAKISYQSIVNTANSNPTPLSLEELDRDVALSWTLDSTSAMDYLDTCFPSEEAMIGIERSWDDLHHRSYFLPDLQEVESSFSSPSSTSDVHAVLNPLALA